MRTVKTILIPIAFLFISNTTHGQFWKKMVDKAEKKIKIEAEGRLENRVNKSIDKVFDGAENTIDGNVNLSKSSTTLKNIELPDIYHFDWKYTLIAKSKEGEVKMHYMLKQKATYFGVVLVLDEKNKGRNYITIMDKGRNAYITFMDVGGQKMMRKMNFPEDIYEIGAGQNNDLNFVKTDTKEILGYRCQGFKAQMNDGVMYMYIAKNLPISFNRALGSSNNLPKGLNQKLQQELENGIMLESEFVSNKNKKDNFKTTCIALKKMEYTLNVSQYK